MTLLPSEVDYKKLTKNFTHHVARILKEYMPFFSSFGSGLEIKAYSPSILYEEMSQKSEVVSFANINNIIIVLDIWLTTLHGLLMLLCTQGYTSIIYMYLGSTWNTPQEREQV